jgi:hypothetical protein
MFEKLKRGDFVEVLKTGCFVIETQGEIGKIMKNNEKILEIAFRDREQGYLYPQEHFKKDFSGEKTSCTLKLKKIPKKKVIPILVMKEL